MTFGQRLKELRKERDLTQSSLSMECNVPQTTISDLEKDKYLPDIDQAQRFASAFCVPISELLAEALSKTGTDRS